MVETMNTFWIGGVCVDPEGLTLSTTSFQRNVEPKVMDVLVLMAQSPGQTISRKLFLDKIWGVEFGSDESLTRAISILRKNFADLESPEPVIKTVPRKGYRLVADIQMQALDVDPQTSVPHPSRPDSDESNLKQETPPALQAENPKSLKLPSRFWAWSAIILVGVAALAVFFFPRGDRGDAVIIEPPANTIALLPFDVLDLTDNETWFADGLEVEIVSALSELPDLQVTSLRSSSRFEDTDADPGKIADTLGVSYLIEGSIRHLDNDLRITVGLIRASDGAQIWSDSYDRPAIRDQLLDIQEDVSDQIIRQLNLSLDLRRDNSEAYVISDESYENYLTAQVLLNKRTPEGLERSQALFRTIIADYPTFSPAYGGLIEAVLLNTSGQEELAAGLVEARRLLEIGFNIDPVPSELFRAAALIDIFEQDSLSALDYIDRALALNPNDAQALQRKSVILGPLNRDAEAAEYLKEAYNRDPLSPIILSNLAQTALTNEDYALAKRYAEQNYEWNNDAFVASLFLSKIYYDLGDYSRAYDVIQSAETRFADGLIAVTVKGEILWRAGLMDKLEQSDETLNWAPMAASLIEDGSVDEAIDLADRSSTFWLNRLTHITIYEWANAEDKAFENALSQLESFGDSDDPSSFVMNKTTALSLFRTLQREKHQDTDRIRAKLDYYVASKSLDIAKSGTELYVVAAWHAQNDDFETSLTWLRHAADKGFIFREILFDPAYDNYRATAEFKNIVEAFEVNAQTLRTALLEQE